MTLSKTLKTNPMLLCSDSLLGIMQCRFNSLMMALNGVGLMGKDHTVEFLLHTMYNQIVTIMVNPQVAD